MGDGRTAHTRQGLFTPVAPCPASRRQWLLFLHEMVTKSVSLIFFSLFWDRISLYCPGLLWMYNSPAWEPAHTSMPMRLWRFGMNLPHLKTSPTPHMMRSVEEGWRVSRDLTWPWILTQWFVKPSLTADLHLRYRLCAGLWGCCSNFYAGKKYLKLCCCWKQGPTTRYPCSQSLNHYLAIMLSKVTATCHQYQVLLGHTERRSSQGLGELELWEKVLMWVADSCPDVQRNTVMQLIVSGDGAVIFLPLNS